MPARPRILPARTDRGHTRFGGAGYTATPAEIDAFAKAHDARARAEHRSFPGEDLVHAGIADLASGQLSVAACVLSLASRRLGRVGVLVRDPVPDPERQLYRLLGLELGTGAHSRYNALIRQIVSYCSAREQDAQRIERSERQPLPASTR